MATAKLDLFAIAVLGAAAFGGAWLASTDDRDNRFAACLTEWESARLCRSLVYDEPMPAQINMRRRIP